MIVGDVLFYEKIWRIGLLAHFLQNADFQFIFARSASTVTSSKNSSVNTTSFPMSLRLIEYVDPKSPTPQTGLCYNFKTVGDRMSVTINH